MVGLRHLEIEKTYSLEYLPEGLGRISGLRSLSKLIVVGVGCGIDELQRLNSPQGCLQIQHLERVSSQKEADKAQLWNKPHLRSLVLSKSEIDDAESERMESVVEGLRPHGNLEELLLYRYTGSKLPSWMEGMQCLRKLGLYFCLKLEWLPHLPSLEEFTIWALRNEMLPDGGWEQLVTLQKLKIALSFELKRLPDGLAQLQSLEHLYISNCFKLESVPEGLGQLKKLNSLTIGGSEALSCLPDSLGRLESLEHLHISGLKKLKSLPRSLGQLKALNRLDIWNCEALGSLPQGLQDLSLLRELKISSCPLLSDRCERDGGEDWHKISHIPNIFVNGKWIQRSQNPR